MGETTFYEGVLAEVFGDRVSVLRTELLSGGCINHATAMHTSTGKYFLKWNDRIPADMFAKEARGLSLLAESDTVRVPRVYGSGALQGKHYILLEFLDGNLKNSSYWADFGRALAGMHRNNIGEKHGLDHDNYIGRLYQKNSPAVKWADFFIENRLEIQLDLAMRNGTVDRSFAKRYRAFYKHIPDLLPEEPPSLLHGDLWGGNVITGPEGQACFIDPAVYYGNREIELSFTKMFGGFGQDFYGVYREMWPLEPGFEQRVDIYNMYPSMVHVNLFGTSYLGGVEHVLSQYV